MSTYNPVQLEREIHEWQLQRPARRLRAIEHLFLYWGLLIGGIGYYVDSNGMLGFGAAALTLVLLYESAWRTLGFLVASCALAALFPAFAVSLGVISVLLCLVVLSAAHGLCDIIDLFD